MYVCVYMCKISSRRKTEYSNTDGMAAAIGGGGEVAVDGRRQSRVLIVKSKIANELQRKPRKMVSFAEVNFYYCFYVYIFYIMHKNCCFCIYTYKHIYMYILFAYMCNICVYVYVCMCLVGTFQCIVWPVQKKKKKKRIPFWWSRVIDCEKRIKRLSTRLNHLCDLVLEFCDVCNHFSDQCSAIYHAVKKSWEDVENEYAMDILSLNAQMNELGEQFAHMSSASRQLAITVYKIKRIVEERRGNGVTKKKKK
ncbi:hypothetical protein RFI_11194 [Reticulomyxa filosa]|uniref:Uncharacterized protein n=1 Tax=Reticulomyxa filosa TaxID=46433 RepID=X6NKQ8_RETFI|nr:hypothetical protein RFI_11194 [Reticulomyxa filosa]|eukprot:ETO25942.1 hypothetical protein RFI_11194 [Reticulomyxa filosa]